MGLVYNLNHFSVRVVGMKLVKNVPGAEDSQNCLINIALAVGVC